MENPGQKLIEATMAGDLVTMREALEGGAPVTVKDLDGHTPLHIAARMGNRAACELLLSFDADIMKLNNGLMTSFEVAAEAGQNEICQLFYDHGASPNEVEGFFCTTPLFQAARKDHVETCRLLLDLGTNINAEAAIPKTALGYALEAGESETAKFLIRHKAKLYKIPVTGSNRGQLPPPVPHPLQMSLLQDMEQNAKNRFAPHKPITRELCLTNGRPSDAVLDACVSEIFFNNVALRLTQSGKAEDIELFSDLWAVMPKCWKNEYPILGVNSKKSGAQVTPAAGLGSGGPQHE